MEIRIALSSDRPAISEVHIQAFGQKQGSEIAQLVDNLFDDDTAAPRLSLVAVFDGRIVGHILFSSVHIIGASAGLSAQILAPLAVLPELKNRRIGTRLIQTGLAELRKSGVQLVFVLGHPGYYPRCGFTPAGIYGFEAPYPIPEEHAAAWMVQELSPYILNKERGQVQCAISLRKPEYWRE